MNKFEEKKIEMEVFGEIYEEIIRRKNNLFQDYRKLDELEQATEWNSETKKYEPVWEDEEKTVPHLVNKWGYVDISVDDMTETQKFQLKAYEKAMSVFEKLI